MNRSGVRFPQVAQEVLHQRNDLVEVRLQQPMPAAQQVKRRVRQVAVVGAGRLLRHVSVVRTPNDQRRRLLLAKKVSIPWTVVRRWWTGANGIPLAFPVTAAGQTPRLA